MNNPEIDNLPQSLTRERVRRHGLREFIRQAWGFVEGARPLKWNWHIDVICRHLEALVDGSLGSRRLCINVPPRTSKSTIVTIMFPCWLWTIHPWTQFLFGSHNFALSKDHAYKRRAILESDWYRRAWPNIQFQGDRNNIMEIANTQRGMMAIVSLGTPGVTGRGGDYLLLDDPNNAEQMESEVQRASILRWIDVTWSTRANDPKTVKEILVQQRTHIDDVTGHVLRNTAQNWVHLKIPMEAVEGKSCTTPIWTDPRAPGQIIDPERFPPAYLLERRATLGPYAYAGQYDQEPYPLGGGMIKAEWIGRWSPSKSQPGHIQCGSYMFDPARAFRFCVVDLAMTEKQIGAKKINDPDWTVMGAFVCISTPQGPLLALTDLLRVRSEGPASLDQLEAFHRHHRFAVIGVEDIAEKSWYQFARQRGLPVREISTKKSDDVLYTIDKDKTGRVLAASVLMARPDRPFFVPDYAPWLGAFLEELMQFPNGSHDDQVDVVSAACAIAQSYKDGSYYEASPSRSILIEHTRRDRDEVPNPLAGWEAGT